MKLSRWYYLSYFVMLIVSTTGAIFSWPAVYNTVGKYYDYSYSELLKIYIPATSLNPIGASLAGFLLDSAGSRWATVTCLTIGLVGAIIWTKAFYNGEASKLFNAGYCIMALGLGGTNVTVANVASLFSNPSAIYTLNSALYAASVFPFLFVDLSNQAGFDAKYGYLIYACWIAFLLLLGGITLPRSYKECDPDVKPPSKKENLKQFAKILKQPKFYIFVFLTDVICTVCYVQYTSNVNDVMTEVGAPSYTSTVWTVISGCGGLIVTPFVAPFAKRFGVIWMLIISYVLYIVFAGCLWIRTPWAPILTCCIYVVQKAFFYAGQYTFFSWMWGWELYGYCIGFMDIITFIFIELLQLYSDRVTRFTPLKLTALLLTIAACTGSVYAFYLFVRRHNLKAEAILEPKGETSSQTDDFAIMI